MNIENLIKVRDMLETIPPELFNIESFRTTDFKSPICNTPACAIGHATRLAPELVKYNYNGTIDFDRFSKDFLDLDTVYDEFGYLFGGEWCYKNNTAKGVIERINYFLEHGRIPDEF